MEYNGQSKVIKALVRLVNTIPIVSDIYSPTSSNAMSGKAVASALSAIETRSYEVVQTLPQTGKNGIIYLVPKAKPQTQNLYDQYIWVNNDWEFIGDTALSLDGYVPETRKINNKTLEQDITLTSDDIGLPDNLAYIEEDDTPVEIPDDPPLTRSNVIDNLISSATNMPLSGHQGNVLYQMIQNLDPTSAGGYVETVDANYDDPTVKNRYYKVSKVAVSGTGLGNIYVCGRNPQNDANCRAEIEVPEGHYLVFAGQFGGGRIDTNYGLTLVAVGRDNNYKILALSGSTYIGADATDWQENKFKIYYSRYNSWCAITAIKIAPIIPL